MNDPYDPYISLSGKSALYFTQAFASYKYCRVYGASITVTITDNVAANTIPMIFALVLNSTTNNDTPSTIDDILALPKSRCRVMRYYPNRIGSSRRLKLFAYISDVFWLTRQQYDAILPSATYDLTNIGSISSPTNKAICSIYYGKLVDTGTPTAVECFGDIRVKYYTKMWVRQNFSEPGLSHDEEPE